MKRARMPPGSKMYSSSFRLTNRDIDLAFEARHLFLVCQPKVALGTGEALGAEAYIRWNHPDYGLLPPGLFLSFFERRERSGELTRYVASAAADAMVDWAAAGCDWPLSINLGAADLADKRLPGDLDGILGERGLDPSRLTLEVPEGAFARHGEAAAGVIRELRRLGFRTALDGGGAVIVPDDVVSRDCFDEIKIGGAAIIQFAGRLRHAGLGFVGRRVALAASRGLEATAVGVEDETTLAALPALGFTAAQGAHICRPVPLADLIGWTAPRRPVSVEPAVEIDVAPATPDTIGEPAETHTDDDILLLTDPIEDAVVEAEIVEAEAVEVEVVEAEVIEAEAVEVEVVEVEEAAVAENLPPETPAALPVMPIEEPGLFLSWEDLDFHVPGEEVRAVAWRIDRVCLFPDRWLVALIRKPRRLAHMRKARPAQKSPPAATKAVTKTAAKPAPRPRRPRAPRWSEPGLVTRPSLVQLALGF
jgi:EAL domain-containing protein (putative c-di-GMP-specific phosphodiesterase class I)